MNKYRETPPLKKGDMVVMHTCVEARNPKNYGKVWRCRTDQFSRGSGVYEQHSVFLEGFTGSFAAEYLQKVDIPDQSEEIERLKEAIGQMHDHHGVLTNQVVDEVKKHAKSCVEHELSIRALKDKLQDAHAVLLELDKWYNDGVCTWEPHCPPELAVIWRRAASVRQRIQGGVGDASRQKD
ncbi:hypothetical protein [Paenibacillus alvei]|uniref:hypothetical protein n=1 Tax=Paenibacillus alvei TaxID=44250 RepID=UPI002E160363